MTGWVAAGIVAGLAVALWGLQTLAQAMRSSPMDTMRPGPLIQRPDAAREWSPPASLSAAEQLVEDAAVSGSVTQQRLWPVVASLARDRGAAVQPPSGDTRRWLREALDELERDSDAPEPATPSED